MMRRPKFLSIVSLSVLASFAFACGTALEVEHDDQRRGDQQEKREGGEELDKQKIKLEYYVQREGSPEKRTRLNDGIALTVVNASFFNVSVAFPDGSVMVVLHQGMAQPTQNLVAAQSGALASNAASAFGEISISTGTVAFDASNSQLASLGGGAFRLTANVTNEVFDAISSSMAGAVTTTGPGSSIDLTISEHFASYEELATDCVAKFSYASHGTTLTLNPLGLTTEAVGASPAGQSRCASFSKTSQTLNGSPVSDAIQSTLLIEGMNTIIQTLSNDLGDSIVGTMSLMNTIVPAENQETLAWSLALIAGKRHRVEVGKASWYMPIIPFTGCRETRPQVGDLDPENWENPVKILLLGELTKVEASCIASGKQFTKHFAPVLWTDNYVRGTRTCRFWGHAEQYYSCD